MRFTKEILLDNLPDFINSKLENEELKKAILNEIDNNPEFRHEYNLLSNTLNNINNYKLSEPPETYFNSILPRINERISEKSYTNIFIKKLSSYWKYAVPVAAIILFFIGYRTIFNSSEYLNQIKRDSQYIVKNYSNNDFKNSDTLENKTTEEESGSDYTTEQKFDNKQKKSGTKENFTEEQISSYIDLSENSDDDELFFNDADINYEQDFENLNSEELNDLITKINNSNL